MFPSYSEVIPPNMDEKDVQIPKISILRLFFVLVVSIIISDASVQIIFAYLPLQFPLNSDWLDIFLHAALTIPVIYVFANRPMKELLGKLSETSKFADLTMIN